MKHIFPAILFTIVVVVVAYQLGESWLRDKEQPVRLVEKPGWQAPSLYLDNVLEGEAREERNSCKIQQRHELPELPPRCRNPHLGE